VAKRIAVVLSQSLTADAQRRSREEDLVTQLLLEHGVDVALVPYLENIDTGDTGALCLEGINGDMVLLSWLGPAEAQKALRRLGIGGRSGLTKLNGKRDPCEVGVPQMGSHRTIYHLDLQTGAPASVYADEIRRIREEASRQTLEIVDLSASSGNTRSAVRSPRPGKSVAPPRLAEGTMAVENTSLSDSNQASSAEHVTDDLPTETCPSDESRIIFPQGPADDWETEDARLDQLIDRLDDLDS
jgi:hypothetical protein